MPGLYIPCSLDEKIALINLAESKYRAPRDQARLILVEALRVAGALPKEATTLTETVRETVEA